MNSIEITFQRALKVWWGFVWRSWVLMFPMMIVLMPVMLWVTHMMPKPEPGMPISPMRPDQIPGFAGKFGLLWLVMMVSMTGLQVVAMQWMLKTKWSDFQLKAVPPSGTEQQPSIRQI